MSANWYDYAYDHLEELGDSGSRESKALLALFCFDGEFNNGGLVQYLMNESADTWNQLGDAFEISQCPQGINWMRSVEAILGGAIPHDRDERLDAISSMPEYLRGEDPFEGPDAVLRAGLMDDIQLVAENLVTLIQQTRGLR